MTIFVLFFLLCTGVCAGILSGLLGLGGGIVIIPTLVYLFQHNLSDIVPSEQVMHMAIPTSLVSVLFTSMVSTYTHQRKGSVRWDIWRGWGIGLIAGSLMGSYFMTLLNIIWLQNLFAGFLVIVVIKLLAEHRFPKTRLPMNSAFLLLIALVIGALSATLGVGGGILMIPVLLGLGCSMPESAATSSASMIPLAIVAGISFIILGNMQDVHIAWSTGYIFWPAVIIISAMGIVFAPIGAKLAYLLPATWTKRLLAAILLIVALQMLKL